MVRSRRTRTLLPVLIAGAAVVLVARPATGLGTAQQQAPGASAPSTTAPNPAPPNQAIELMNQGNSLLEKRDYSGAEAAFQKAVSAYPDFAGAHRGLGIAFWQQGQLGQAWQELSTVARLEPQSARAHYEAGQVAWQIYSSGSAKAAASTGLSPDDFQSIALTEIEKAVSLDPHDFKMRLDLSELEVAAGEKKQAEADALGAVGLAKSAPQRALAHVALARAWLASGDQMRAQAEYRKAIEEDPASGKAYLGLGQIALFQQNSAEAEQNFKQAIQASPDLAPAYAALAKLQIAAHQRMEALTTLQKAVVLDPEDWQSQYELAKLEMDAGDSGQAKSRLTKIMAEQPDFLPAGETLALLQLRQGDVQGAITRAQSLVARNPQAAEGHRVLALAFWRERQTDASLGECALALAADPQSTSMQALQAFELWQTGRKRDSQRILQELVHRDRSIFSAMAYCRLIVCGTADFPPVADFLHQNRWVIAPRPEQ